MQTFPLFPAESKPDEKCCLSPSNWVSNVEQVILYLVAGNQRLLSMWQFHARAQLSSKNVSRHVGLLSSQRMVGNQFSPFPSSD
jgi:hypothetical protein